MKVIDRSRDVILGADDLEHLHTFKNFPVFMGCTSENQENDITCDMSWHISRSSGAVQLNPLLPLDVIYKNSHGSGTTGKLWDQHHESFAKFIMSFNIRSALEIGGGHGFLADKVLSSYDGIRWTIVEPNPTCQSKGNLNVVSEFFDKEFKLKSDVDAVIHSHVLEHVYEPNEFLSHISSFSKVGSLLIFSVPNMEQMIRSKYTNCVNFEHTILLTEPYIDFLLTKHGFCVIEKNYFKSDHSIFYCARRVESAQESKISDELYEKNKSYFIDYLNSHIDDVKDLNKIMSDVDEPIYLFGAHVFSQYLISFGLNMDKIVSLLDNDGKKCDKRLFGTNLYSKTPEILRGKGKAYVILRAGVYNDEIKKQILDEINSDVIFI